MPTYCEPWPVNSSATGAPWRSWTPRSPGGRGPREPRGASSTSRATTMRRWLKTRRPTWSVKATSARFRSRMRREMCGQVPRRLVEAARGLGGEDEELAGAGRVGGGEHRRLLDDGVGVRPPDAEGAEPGAPRPLALPLHQLGGYEERAVLEVDLRVRRLEVKALGDLPVLQREHRLDEPGHAGRGVEVADVRLHGPDRAEALASVHLRQALVRPAISAGSPSAVAVPWAST